MLQIAIIVFRETLEISLILGILLAATKIIERREPYIISGVILGVIGAAILALFANQIADSFDGAGQEIVNICILAIAIVMLTVTIVWMKGQVGKMRETVNEIAINILQQNAPKIALTTIVATTIFRELAEVILFIYSIVAVKELPYIAVTSGACLGAIAGFTAGGLLYFGIFKIAKRYVFKVTSFLLVLIAAGLASELANLLSAADIIQQFTEPLWDSSWFVMDQSITGQFLNVTIGYTATPSVIQLLFYVSTLVGILLISNYYNKNIERR